MAAGDASTYPLTLDLTTVDASMSLDVRAEGVLEAVVLTVSKVTAGSVDVQIGFNQSPNFTADDDNSVIGITRLALDTNTSIVIPMGLGSGVKLLAGERIYLHGVCGAGTGKVSVNFIVADKATRPSPRRR